MPKLPRLDVSDIFLMGVGSVDLDKIASRVTEICDIQDNDIFLKSKQ